MKIGKTTVILAAIFAASAVVPSAAAQEAAPATRTGQSEASLAAGTRINAELNSSIDSKKVKAGDTVMAHATEAVKTVDDRTILPRGTKLVGHVTQATARAKGDNESTLAISFDKAILKGEDMPLNATIQALGAPGNPSVNGPDLDTMPRAGSPSTNPSATNSGMGGNRGSRPDGATGYPGSYPTANGSGSNSGMGGGTESGGELAANQHGVFGLNGLRLTTTTSNNEQVSVITAAGKNVHLDSGTRLLLVTRAGEESSGR